MCLPLIAAGVSAAGSIVSGIAGSQSYRAQAAYADRQAQLTRQKGAYESARLRDQHDRQLASMRGQYLSSGIALSGSAADVLADSAAEASLDEQAIRFGSEINAGNLEYQGKMARANASNAMIGGFLDAGAGFVKGLSNLSSNNQSLALATSAFPSAPSASGRTVIGNVYRGLW